MICVKFHKLCAMLHLLTAIFTACYSSVVGQYIADASAKYWHTSFIYVTCVLLVVYFGYASLSSRKCYVIDECCVNVTYLCM